MSYDDYLPSAGDPFATVNQFGGVDYTEQNKGVTPIFFAVPTLNPAKTAESGTPRYDEEFQVRLLVAGDNLNQYVGPVDDAIKARFADQWERFIKNREARQIDGTPLKEWPLLTPMQIKEFEALNIYSIEALTVVADSHIAKLPDGRIWREKAKAHLALAKDSAVATKLAGENERLREQMEEQGKTLAALSAQVDALTKAAPGGKRAA